MTELKMPKTYDLIANHNKYIKIKNEIVITLNQLIVAYNSNDIKTIEKLTDKIIDFKNQTKKIKNI